MAHMRIHDIDSYERCFTAVEPIFLRDDLSFVNIEFVVDQSRPVSGFPLFNGPVEYVEAAVAAGVDVFALANNHTFDYGDTGISGTVASIKTIQARRGGVPFVSGVAAVAARDGDYPEFVVPTSINVRGIRVGFIAVTQFSNEWPDDRDVYSHVNVLDGSNRERFLSYLSDRTDEYDLFVLSYHGDWVEEYDLEARAAKRTLFRRIAEAGVHIVWGHHPHVLQGADLLEIDGRSHLLLYSTGNLLGAQGYRVDHAAPDPDDPWAFTHDSMLYRVTVATGSDANVLDVDAIPVFQRILPGRRAGVVLETAATVLVRELDPAWRAYYRHRRDYLEQMAFRPK